MAACCDGCGQGGFALHKISLGRDFFGAPYDRLTPASDKSPAWYCPGCSVAKGMQVDCRAISAALIAGRGGEKTPLDDAAERHRAEARLEEVQARIAVGGGGRLLDREWVDSLRKAVEALPV